MPSCRSPIHRSLAALAAPALCAGLAVGPVPARAQEPPAVEADAGEAPTAAVTTMANTPRTPPSTAVGTRTFAAATPVVVTGRNLWSPVVGAPRLPNLGLDAWVEPRLRTVPFRLAPLASWDTPNASLSVIGLASRMDPDADLRHHGGALAANVLLAGRTRDRGRLGKRAFGAELILRATRSEWGVGATPESHESVFALPEAVRAEARGHLIGPRTGLWIATGYEHAEAPIPLLGLGGWLREQRMVLSWDIQQTAGALPRRGTRGTALEADSLVSNDPRIRSEPRLHEQITLTTARATARFEDDRIEFESVGGVTLSPLTRPRTWAHATVAVRLLHGLAVFAAAGNRDAALYAIQPSDERGTTVGMRLSGWRRPGVARTLGERAQVSSCRLRKLAATRYVLELRAPGARLVEVMGSMTGWEPVRLERFAGERWQTSLTIEPGVHQLNVRADGGDWMPPPGAPSTTDGYGGTVGIVVVE